MTITTPSKQIKRLAEIVDKEQGVRIAFGRTNGRDCLHISKADQKVLAKDELPPGLSYTIYDESEWTYHRWNGEARLATKEASADILAAVRNKEAI